jgi:regulator of RNase E activity RraA
VIFLGVSWRLSLAGLLLFSSLPLCAQFDGFDHEQLLKYTAQNPYARSIDGRPQVPDYWLKRLETVSTTTAAEVLREEGYPNQWEDGWAILHPEKKLIGRAFTVQFMPSRPDLEGLLEKEAAEAANEEEIPTPVTQRVMEMFGPGDIPVVDVMGRIEEGTFGGDNLIFSMFVATGNGFVVDGSFRDLDGVYPMQTMVFSRGYHPGVRGRAILSGLNTPTRIGKVTVMPGDIVLGDRMGVVFIPPHLVQKVVVHTGGGRREELGTITSAGQRTR